MGIVKPINKEQMKELTKETKETIITIIVSNKK